MKFLVALFTALTLLQNAHADRPDQPDQPDLDFDADDIPVACQSICRPTLELSRLCDVDDDTLGDDEVAELEAERGCVCTNTSFDVSQMTALCQSCMSQNTNDPADELEDIDDIMAICGFQAAQFTAADANRAAGVVVQVT